MQHGSVTLIHPLISMYLILSGKETSTDQYTLECNRILHFEVGQSQVCYDYNITNDDICELGASETQFKLRLSLSSTTNLHIDPYFSSATVTVDDSNEPECCMLFIVLRAN